MESREILLVLASSGLFFAALFLLRQAGNEPAQVAVTPTAPEPVEHAIKSPMAPPTVVPNPLVVLLDTSMIVSIVL